MPITDDIRKTLTDPTPLYFAAGVIDKIREEAPERIAAVRSTDPKEVQAKLTEQAKETQAKVTDVLGSVDTDIKKLREQAQHYALQGVGFAAEYAVKAREAYDEFADRGRGAVKAWRGEEAETEAPQVTVEREPVKVARPPEDAQPTAAKTDTAEAGSGTKSGEPKSGEPKSGTGAKSTAGAAGAAGAAKKPTASTRKTTASSNGNGNGAGTQASAKNGAKKTAPKSDS